MFLIFLLLGATTDGPSGEASQQGARVQAVASATIVRGVAIEWEAPASRATASYGDTGYAGGALRTAGVAAGTDGRTILVQEFH